MPYLNSTNATKVPVSFFPLQPTNYELGVTAPLWLKADGAKCTMTGFQA